MTQQITSRAFHRIIARVTGIIEAGDIPTTRQLRDLHRAFDKADHDLIHENKIQGTFRFASPVKCESVKTIKERVGLDDFETVIRKGETLEITALHIGISFIEIHMIDSRIGSGVLWATDIRVLPIEEIEEGIPAIVIEEFKQVRDSGACNTMSRGTVHVVANNMGLFNLVLWIEDNPKEYASILMVI